MKLKLKRKLTQADYLLIAANLLPVYGVWFLGWDPLEAFIVYALETVVIGIFTLFKLGIQWAQRGKDEWQDGKNTSMMPGLFFMIFFCIHYGMFVAIQLGMFIQVSGLGKSTEFWETFKSAGKFINSPIAIMLCGFVVHNGFRLVNEFIMTNEYRKLPMMQIMFQPYGRIFVQQFTVILGSMFLALGAGGVFVLIFIAVKLIFELTVDYDAIIQKTFDKVSAESGK